jgi:DNA polymerase III alpha subunit (gram-positive type)
MSKVQKQVKSDKKGKKDHPPKGNNHDNSKMKVRLQRMIEKTQQLKQRKNEEFLQLDAQQQELVKLLSMADQLDSKQIKDGLKTIQENSKNARRKFQRKAKKSQKRLKKEQKQRSKKEKKERKKNSKKEQHPKNDADDSKKRAKEQKKSEKRAAKLQKKMEKNERKRLKQEKKEKLELARIEALPSSNDEIGGQPALNVYIDGYNIIGCDSQMRKNMRKRGGGMKRARTMLVEMVQKWFMDGAPALNLPYKINLNVWFDGNGKDEIVGDIQVSYSSKKSTVDDTLVAMFSKKAHLNGCVLVVTSDRELTLRLHELGVKCMKSGVFYQQYLKSKDDGDAIAVDDVKTEEPENDADGDAVMYPTITDDAEDDEGDATFVKLCKMKMNESDADDGDDETATDEPGATAGCDDDDDEVSGDDDEEEDEEFAEIFKE